MTGKADWIVAHKVIGCAQAGEREQTRLCKRALKVIKA